MADSLIHSFQKPLIWPGKVEPGQATGESNTLHLTVANGTKGQSYVIVDTLIGVPYPGPITLSGQSASHPLGLFASAAFSLTAPGSVSVSQLSDLPGTGQSRIRLEWRFTLDTLSRLDLSLKGLPTGDYQSRAGLYSSANTLLDNRGGCFSVKALVCPDSSFAFVLRVSDESVVAPFRWYRNDVLLPGEMTDSLICRLPGAYRMESTTDCGPRMCCPFVIEADSLPTYSVTIHPASCLEDRSAPDGGIGLALGSMPEFARLILRLYDDHQQLIVETAMGSMQNAFLTHSLLAGVYTLQLETEGGCVKTIAVRVPLQPCCRSICPPITITRRRAVLK